MGCVRLFSWLREMHQMPKLLRQITHALVMLRLKVRLVRAQGGAWGAYLEGRRNTYLAGLGLMRDQVVGDFAHIAYDILCLHGTLFQGAQTCGTPRGAFLGAGEENIIRQAQTVTMTLI